MGSAKKRKVLLVEDEATVRLIGSDALMDAGYEVVDAGSADEALAALSAMDDVEVLFTDIRMPGSMNGLELASLVHKRWPAIKILVTSGDTWPPRSDLPDDGKFLAKPYRVERLQDEIEQLFS